MNREGVGLALEYYPDKSHYRLLEIRRKKIRVLDPDWLFPIKAAFKARERACLDQPDSC